MKELCHYTIETHNARRSPRSDVTISLDEVSQYLSFGRHDIETCPGFLARTSIDRNVAMISVWLIGDPNIPLVTFACCPDDDSLRACCQIMAKKDTLPGLWAPACLVQLHPTLVRVEPWNVDWLGDFERCCAWGWFEKLGNN